MVIEPYGHKYKGSEELKEIKIHKNKEVRPMNSLGDVPV